MDYQERDRKKSVLLSCILQLILPWERNVRKQESTGMLCTNDKSVSVLEGLEINFFFLVHTIGMKCLQLGANQIRENHSYSEESRRENKHCLAIPNCLYLDGQIRLNYPFFRGQIEISITDSP